MGYREGDIQVSDDALGLGPAIRIEFDDGTLLPIETDPDNDKIRIIRLEKSGGPTLMRTDDFNNVFLLMGG